MKTVRDVLSLAEGYLQRHGVVHNKRIASLVLAHILGVDRIHLHMNFDRPLDDNELELYRQGLRRLAAREPWQYVVGEIEFFGCDIKVSSKVLIPRQETEILVDMIAKELLNIDLTGKVLWDVCCGSGCIGIALKKKFSELYVILSDVDEGALDIARENAERNGVEVQFLHGDMLEPFAGQRANFVVCNPPYIAEKDYSLLEPEVRDHEPRHALISGETGLEYYEKMAMMLPNFLEVEGKVWFEIGHDQGDAVTKLFDTKSWSSGVVSKDWAGNERFFCVCN